MIETAMQAAYGKEAAENWIKQEEDQEDRFICKSREEELEQQPRVKASKIKRNKVVKRGDDLLGKYQIGDSVMVFPDKKIGIVCVPVNEKGVLRVQLQDKKIWINHKRVRLHVAAKELYPEDYDFSIIFDTVENRKARHEMERKYTEQTMEYSKDDVSH